MSAKHLFVLRHAKSSWDDPGLDDHDRPLAPRGRKAARVMADYLRANSIHPALVLCSTARRTVETLAGIEVGGEHLIEAALYGASTTELIERLHRVPDETESVMVIGHNPAIQTLVLRLAAGDDSPDLAEVQRKFSTGALATLTFENVWSQLGPGGASLVSFVRPKQLSVS